MLKTNKILQKFLGLSLYYKLFAVFGLTFIILISSLTFVTKVNDKKIQEAQRAQLKVLANYIVSQVLLSPNKTQIEEFSNTFDLYISVTHLDHIIAEDINLNNVDSKNILKIQKNNYTFFFARKPIAIEYALWQTLGVFIIVIPILLVGSNLIVAFLLRPLKSLVQGTKEISQGNYHFKIPIDSHDELGELAQNFNIMSEKINEQIRDMQTLLLGIAHEFKTPLTRIKLILEKVNQNEIKQSLNSELDLINHMTDSILEQNRLEKSPQVLNLIPLNLTDFLRQYCQKENIESELPNKEVLADIDSLKFTMLLNNLVENSKRYGKPPIQLSLTTQDNVIILTFWDNGQGVSLKDLEHLFKPFYRVQFDRSKENSKQGFGLGLSLVSSIVKAHKGKVKAINREHAGLVIQITLPLINES